MTYLLIDTCSWSRLLQDNAPNSRISLLNHWFKTEQVKILLPTVIIAEWHRNKEENLKKATESIESKVRTVHEMSRMTGKESISLPPITPAILETVNTIESIFPDSIQFDVPESMKALCADRSFAKKAPFHIKGRSMADAFIFFSTLWYCKTNKITELCFISNNTEDFAAVKSNRELHPELIDATNEFGVNITYYSDILTGIRSLRKSLVMPPKELDKKKAKPKDYIYVDRTLDPTTQLYNYLKRRFTDIRFLPTSLFTDHYPFIDEKSKLHRYTTFRLHINREELYKTLQKGRELLKEQQDKTSKEYEIFRWLSNSYIYYFYYRPDGIYIDTNLPLTLRKNYNNTGHRVFDYTAAKEEITVPREGIIERMKLAYANYQLGRFQDAAWQFFDIAQIAAEAGNNTSYIICLFNLKRLKTLIALKQKTIDQKLVDLIDDIDVEEELYKVSTEENTRLHKFIVREEFFHEQIKHVHDERKLLIDSYYNKLAGGYSDDQYIYSLICVFAQIDQFVQANYIVYEHTYDYIHSLADSLVEGVIASHGTPKKHQSKLPKFDNYIFLRIIRFAQPDNILKYFNRYNLQELKYSQESTPPEDCFHKYVENFFNNPPEFLDNLQNDAPYQNNYLRERTTNILNNIVVLLGITDIPAAIMAGFLTSMIHFLHHAPIHCKCKYLEVLLARKKSFFSQVQLDELLRLCTEKDDYKEKDLLAGLLYAYVSVGRSNALSERYETLVKDTLKDYETKDFKPTSDVLAALYAVASNEERVNMTAKINNILEQDFSPALFYDASINDIIVCRELELDQLIDFVAESKSKHKRLVDYDSSDSFQTYEMNALFNLCLKENCDFTRTIFEPVKGIAPYYDWIMNIEHSDYRDFDFDWLCINNSIYFYNHFRKNSNLMTRLIGYLKDRKEHELERLLLKLTYYMGITEV